MRRTTVLTVALAVGLALFGTAPTQAEPLPAGSGFPTGARAAAAVLESGCLASSSPGGYKLCGYREDVLSQFSSGRVIRAWGGVQVDEASSPARVRLWLKVHAVGVQGTVVDGYYEFKDVFFENTDSADVLWTSGYACTVDVCPYSGRDVYYVGSWHPRSEGIRWRSHGWIWGHIQGTNDETSTSHCVSSYFWRVGVGNDLGPHC